MPSYTTTVRINAPLSDVFGAFSDPSVAAQCLTRVQRVKNLSATPGLNATYREWRVLENGKEIVQDFRVVELEADERCTLESLSAGIRFTFTSVFERASNLTVARIVVAAQGVTFIAKLLLPVVWSFALVGAKTALAHDLGELKACLEGRGRMASKAEIR